MDTTVLDTTSIVYQGAAITAVSAFHTQMESIFLQMLPFCYVAIPLIILDLYYGRKKAIYQYENNISSIPYKIQKSIKMTVQKIFNYISWIFLSTSLSLAFNTETIVIVIMSIIYGLEVLSLLNKYGESKGIDIDEVGMLKVLFKFIWSRITGNFDETFDDVVKKQNNKRLKKKKQEEKQ